MKKFFSLVLALVMALSLTTVAWGADVTTSADFADAVEAGGTVTLGADITLTSADWTDNNTIKVYNDVVINLNGWDLNASASTRRPFELYNGANLTIVANGTETVTVGNYGLVYIPDGASDVTLTGGNYVGNTDKGALIKPKGDEAINITLTGVNYTDSSAKNWLIDGTSYDGPSRLTITVNGGSYDVWCGITAHYADITVKNAVFNVESVGIESGLGSTALVENCTITASGGDNAAAPTAALVASNDGTMTVKGGTYTGSANAATDGKNALAIYPTGGSITVESGTFDGDVKMWNSDSAKDYEVTISGGTVTGEFETTATEDVDVTVSGGTFPNADVADYLASGVSVQPDGSVGKTASFSGATGTTKFSEDGTYYVLNASSVWEKVTYVPADEEDGEGNVAYFDGAANYVICKKNDDGAMMLTSGMASGDKLLGYVKVAPVEYTMKGTKVSASAVVNCDTDFHAKGYKYVNPVTGVNEYYVDDAVSGTKYILVGTEVKQVSADTTAVLGGHVLKLNKTNALDALKTTYEYKCVRCGDVFKGVEKKVAGVEYTKYDGASANTAKLVTAYTAAGYNCTNYIDEVLYLVKGATPSVDTPSTDKVTSAETFDAGIAMYVGMSVMAAAGSAVVIGKKKD